MKCEWCWSGRLCRLGSARGGRRWLLSFIALLEMRVLNKYQLMRRASIHGCRISGPRFEPSHGCAGRRRSSCDGWLGARRELAFADNDAKCARHSNADRARGARRIRSTNHGALAYQAAVVDSVLPWYPVRRRPTRTRGARLAAPEQRPRSHDARIPAIAAHPYGGDGGTRTQC